MSLETPIETFSDVGLSYGMYGTSAPAAEDEDEGSSWCFYFFKVTRKFFSAECCKSLTLVDTTGEFAKTWKKYLGQYTFVQNGGFGAPIYQNSDERYLFLNEKGKWSANTMINEKGVLRGINKNIDNPCPSTTTKWKYWDDGDWKPIKIKFVCDISECCNELSRK